MWGRIFSRKQNGDCLTTRAALLTAHAVLKAGWNWDTIKIKQLNYRSASANSSQSEYIPCCKGLTRVAICL